ncbi:15-hydroxyprostaglandin dehydrogenase [NAD(+)]-like, partial [Pieris rapae]|uniref:15-hydroxyprostaglandin dehydrogenase [NAD(+)]-like n=1 Tax=Pieris rapae TaxID=64459 RepID=UPI001E27B50C
YFLNILLLYKVLTKTHILSNMSREIKNKVILITGGASGIGYGAAGAFLHNKALLVIILDIDEVQGNKAVHELKSKYGQNKAVFFKCDVTKDLEVVWAKLIATYNIDVLVNSAGIVDEKVPNRLIDINLTALIQFSLKFMDQYRRDKSGDGGTIINVSSIYGTFTDPYFPVYQATKFGVLAFTKSLGNQVNFKRTGVRVLALCPGFTKTKLAEVVKTWDDNLNIECAEYLNKFTWQTVDKVSDAFIEIFEEAESGSGWVIDGGKPIREVDNF